MNRYKGFAIPYFVWMILFTVIPLIMMSIFALSNIQKFSIITFSFSSFSFDVSHFSALTSQVFLNTFGRSMKYAAIATLGCLLVGYPIAYFITKLPIKNKFFILLIFILPMWTNTLLRIQTINDSLKEYSFLSNVFHISINLTDMKDLKLILVMILVYLPFMIFPIYTVLEKLDYSLLEASNDLGANPVKSFFKITLPLSLKGVFSGIMMVFLPSAMGYTIPAIVTDGDSNYYMIGQLIEQKFNKAPEYNVGSLMSLVILIFVLGSLYIISKIDAEGETLL